MGGSRSSASRVWWIAAAMFALSGGAALVLQVVWTRWLSLALGSSSRAATIVLASFMGGLGLGSWIAGRFGDRKPHLDLKLFAAAEVIVGLWAFVSIPLLSDLLPGWAAALGNEGGLPWGMRALFAVVGLIVPTVMMGATLPLLSRWAVAVGGLPGRAIGLLYTVNSLGGAAGALAAAFWLISSYGLTRTAALAGGADIVVALGAFALAAAARGPGRPLTHREKKQAKQARKKEQQLVEPVDSSPSHIAPLWIVSSAFFLSGFVGLSLEIGALRVLSILAGSTAYAFAVMLAAFLIGIGLGSLVSSFFADKTRDPGFGVAICLGGLALGIGFARWAFHLGWYQLAGNIASALPVFRDAQYGLEMAGCLFTLLPATLMLGAVVPFVGKLAGAVPDRLARRFGGAYALNTLGAVLGAMAGGLWLVPWIGTAGLFGALAVVATVGALIVALVAVGSERRPLAVAICLVLGLAGVFVGMGADPVGETLTARARAGELLALREGPVQTIAVVEEFNDQQLRFLRLITNQTSLTGTHLYAQRYMRLLGHLPVLWADEPKRALVICLGTGMTAAAVASHPEIEQLDIAEISPEVAEVAPLFSEFNDDVLDDPRTRLHVEDGRHVLLAADEGWDAITLEPPPPRDSGVVSLYSTDFYELASKRLRPGGTVAQWIPLHSQSYPETQMLIRSFVEVFPHVLGFLPVEKDLILIGGHQPLARSLADLTARMNAPTAHSSLARLGFEGPAALLATALLDRDALLAYAGGQPVITDDRPTVEYFARFGKRPGGVPIGPLMENPQPAANLLQAEPDADFLEQFADAQIALLQLNRAALAGEAGQLEVYERLAYEAVYRRPEDPYYLWLTELSDEHLELWRQRAEAAENDPAPWLRLGRALSVRRKLPEALEAYQRAFRIDPNNVETLIQFGDLLLGPGGRPAEGRLLLGRALEQLGPSHPLAPSLRARLRP